MTFKRLFMLIAIAVLCTSVLAQDLVSGDIQVSAERASIGSMQVETLFDGAKFIPVETKTEQGKAIYTTGEKTLYLFDDPKIKQEYEVEGNGLKDTVYLKEPRKLSYRFKGGSLSLESDGSVKIDTGDAEGYYSMRPAVGSDAGGNVLSFKYVIEDDTVVVVAPEDAKYPVKIDPVIVPRYYLKALLHGNIEAADSFSTSVIRDSSTAAHMPALDVASTGSGLNTSNVKFGNASIFLKNAGAGNPIAINMTDSDDWTLGSNNFTICTWIWQKNFTSQSFYIQQEGANYNRFNLSCPGYVSGTVSWYAKRGASTEGATGALSSSALAAAEAGYNRYCAIKNGSTITIYMNSTSLGTGTSTLTKTDLSGPASFGKDDMTYFDLAGKHYDEIVFVNGVGLPIDSPLLTSEWPLYANASNYGYGDDNSTVSLLHMDGSDGGTFFRDEVGNATWTATSATTATNASKFGQSGGFFPSNGNIQTAYSPIFDMQSGDWTVDFWVKTTSENPLFYTVYPSSGSTGWGVVCGSGSCLIRRNNTVPALITDLTTTTSFTPGTFTHIALTRNGSTLRGFQDGTLIGSGSVPSGALYNMWGAAPWIRGYNVSLDEIRVTKGIARWTSNFTPPSTPYGITTPSFTMSPTESGTVPVTVTFNSSTPDDLWTQNDWYWDFGDGSTGTGRNTTHTYTSTGTYSPTLQTFNNNMTAVSAAATFSPGAPVISMAISPNTGTAALLTETTITLTNTTPITSWGFDYGDGYSDTESPTLVSGTGTSTVWRKTHVFASYGYFNYSVNATNSIGTDTAYDYVTVSTEQNQQSTWYSPHQVRFAVEDEDNNRIVGAPFNASVLARSIPDAWLESMYGLQPSVANDLLNGTLMMQGHTGSDGSITFTMLSSCEYNLSIINPTSGVEFSRSVYPTDSQYTVHILSGDTPVNNTYNDIQWFQNVTEPNASYVTMHTWYKDESGRTSLLEQYVIHRPNNTLLNYQSVATPGTGWRELNYTVANTRGNRYSWYMNAVRTV